MQIIKAILIGATGTLGVGMPSVWGSHEFTKEDIWSQVLEDAIPNDKDAQIDTTAWEGLAKSPQTKNAEELKKWCFNAYKEVYYSLIIPKKSSLLDEVKKSSLLDEVKKSCIRSIGDQLSSAEKFNLDAERGGDDVESKLKEKVTSLDSHASESGALEQEPDLKKLKDKRAGSNKEENTDWKTLKEWCKAAYKRGYTGNTSNRWKLVKAYCVKGNAGA